MIHETQNLLRMSDSVSKQEFSEAINAVFSCVQKNLSRHPNYSKNMYQLLRVSNERLWFSTSLRLAWSYLADKEYKLLNELAIELKKACQKQAYKDHVYNNMLDERIYDAAKGDQLLEVCALEIQMCI